MNECVLVVDDDHEIVKAIAILLEKEGYHVLKAYDGVQALELIAQHSIQLILIDVMMPKLDGLSAIMKIRERRNLPIIVLSAKSEDTDKVLGLSMGADDYITKPFNIRILIAKCINLLNNRRKLQERYRALENSSAEQLTDNKLDQDFIDQIIRIVQTRLEEGNGDINVTLLCAELGLSRTKLFLKMKKITGESPHSFIQNIKLKTAAKMLRKNEEYNISDISFQLGFSSLNYFGKSFKEYFGMSPTAYRKVHQEQKE